MRILLALDGSHGADTAHALVRDLAWPDPTHVDVVRVIEPAFDVFLMPAVDFEGSLEDLMGADEVERALKDACADLGGPGRTLESRVIVGRPATIIAELADRLHVDLVVLGSRGRGPISSMVLGSVSAEVVDHAPCPVLVARTSTCHRVLVALDGTPVADRIIETVGELAFLHDAPVEVLCVAPSPAPGPGVMLSGVYGMPITWYEEGIDAAHHSLEEVAASGAERLRAQGIDATASVAEGDPAATIIDAAQRTGADLVVVGTHGRTGMTRLLLGSVARNVLLHAHTSVLVLREPRAPRSATKDTEQPEAVGSTH